MSEAEDTMRTIWQHLEVEFKILHASALWDAFRSGATDAEILDTESFLGVTLPTDVKASYQLHNGSNGKMLIGDPGQQLYQLYSSVEMMNDWQQQMDQQRQIEQGAAQVRLRVRANWMDEDEYQDSEEETRFGFDRRVRCNPPDRGWWWHPAWIPLLRSDSGVRLCLDLAPGPAGQSGQIIKLDFDSGDQCPPVIAPDWRTLLLTFAHDLEAGEYALKKDIYGGIFLSFA